MANYRCKHCKKDLDESEAYEYRGAISCAEHFDEVIQNRKSEREALIEEESRKTKAFEGLDLRSDSTIGRGNREILSAQIEIASKESPRLRSYERGEND